MSSVGSSDSTSGGSGQDAVVRRNREEAQRKESEMVKKHQRELRRINEDHYQRIEDLKNEHARQMTDLQKNSHDTISERDHRYQQEVEDLREMHRKQLQSAAEENQSREDLVRKSIKNDVNQSKANNEARVKQLTDDYTRNIQKLNEQYSNNTEENRKAQDEAIQLNRQRLEDAHDREKTSMIDERNKTVGNLQREFTNYRAATSETKREQDLKHMSEKQRQSENLIRAVQKERAVRQDSEEILRDGFEAGLGEMRERYDKAMAKEREAMNISQTHMKSGAIDRIDGQLRRLELENEDLKDANVRDRLQMKHKQDMEINNIRDAYQKNIDNFKDQRDEAVRLSNTNNRNDVQNVREELGKQIVDSNRFYRGKMDEQSRIHRMAHDNMIGDFMSRNESVKTMADQRVMQIFNDTEEQKTRLIKLQQDNHQTSQRTHQDEMKNLREQLGDDKNAAINRLQDQIRKQELQHSEKMSVVVGKYEKQLTTLKDQMIRERKQNEEDLKRTVEDLQRQHKVAMDQLESKNRERLRQATAHQAEEIRNVNKRHEERLDSVIGEMKKTQKS